MIRNQAEYEEACRLLADGEQELVEQRQQLQAMGLGPEEIQRATAPMASVQQQLREEIDAYERLRRGEIGEVINFKGLGRMLIALRITRGVTQRQLAEMLGVHESQISRDERNEYHGITVDRASRILDALGAITRTTASLSEEAMGLKRSEEKTDETNR